MKCRECHKDIRKVPGVNNQRSICVECAHSHPPDLIINVKSFHAELYSELISPAKLRRLFKTLSKD